ncbi:MAG: cation:proton antiporter [Candidatus Aenigmarchaeota archaeon]|nr:cation:proton antiporter [Candidatus Aenigmarchaeota archaeon]
MGVDPFSLLVLFAVTVFAGYISSFIFVKTGVSDVIWLLGFGSSIALFGLANPALFIILSPFLLALALLIILFDAGLNLDFYQLRRAPRSLLFAGAEFVFSVLSVAAIGILFLHLPPLLALLLGTMVSSASSPAAVMIVAQLHLKPATMALLNLGSAIANPLAIVAAVALVNLAVPATTGYSTAADVVVAFTIGAVVGLVAGIFWLFALDRLKGKPFDYLLTLAVLFALYAFVVTVEGSGAVAALLFGLVLGNGATFSGMLRLKRRLAVNYLLKTFQKESSFFIRSFFFIYIGVVAAVTPAYALYGLAIAAVLAGLRYLAVLMATVRMEITAFETRIMSSLASRGLAAAVLAQLPAVYGVANADLYVNIVFVVIVATVLYTTVAVKLLAAPESQKHEK